MPIQTALFDFFNLFYHIRTWETMFNDSRKDYMIDVMSKMEIIKDTMIICFDIFNTYQLKNNNYVRGEKVFTIEFNVNEKTFCAYEYQFCKHDGDIKNFKEILLSDKNLRGVFEIVIAFEKNILPKLKTFEKETYEMHLIKYGY